MISLLYNYNCDKNELDKKIVNEDVCVYLSDKDVGKNAEPSFLSPSAVVQSIPH